MYRYLAILFSVFWLGVFLPSATFAIPSQFGDSGLFSQPTAETLNAGNICVGLWTNCSSSSTGEATITPVAITLGLGSFLEAYGSYPSLLFNGDEIQSGRGYANIGFKLRPIGTRSSAFKVAVDGQMRRSISDDAALDGLTDKVGRVIVSFKPGPFGFHLSGGFSSNDSPTGQTYDDQTLFGGGIELYPVQRLRLLAEFETASAKMHGADSPSEVTAGFQYFLSPHLTLNIGLGVGLSDASPDWRTLIGFSSCQGVGTYQTPIVRDVPAPLETVIAEPEKVKVVKVRTLSPLAPKVAPAKAEPVSKFEVPVTPNTEEVVVNPGERLAMPTGGFVSALPVAAVGSAGYESSQGVGVAMATVAVVPATLAAGSTLSPIMGSSVESANVRPTKLGRAYALNDNVMTDDGKIVGKKVVDDPRYKANFSKIVEYEDFFYTEFFHTYTETLPVWIEGDVKYELSLRSARPFEDISLKVFKVNGKTPLFKLHLGEKSEVFTFYPVGSGEEQDKRPADTSAANLVPGAVPEAQVETIPVAAATEENIFLKVGKGILLAPVAIIAAPFVGVHYLVTKVTGSASAPAAAVTEGALTAASSPDSPSRSDDFAPVSQGSEVTQIPPDATSASTETTVATASAAPSAGQPFVAPGDTFVITGAPAAAAAVPVVAPGVAPAGAETVAAPLSTMNSPSAPSSAASLSVAPQGVTTAAQSPVATGGAATPANFAATSSAPSAAKTVGTPGEAFISTGVPESAGTTPVATSSNVLSASAAPVGAVAVGTPASATTMIAAPVSAAGVSAPRLGGSETQAPTAAAGGNTIPTSVSIPAVPARMQNVVAPEPKISFEKPVSAMVYRKFRLPEFTFGFDEWSLSEEGKRALAEVAESLRKEERWFFVKIDGYTDNVGSDEYNINLGMRRAISAATYLVVNNGFDPNLMFIKGVGEAEPVATNESEEGRSLNRRIELLILVPKEGP